MKTSDFKSLCERWLDAKEREALATAERREVEDQLKLFFSINENVDSSEEFVQDGFRIRVANRINYKVDSAKLSELATDWGIKDHLEKFFTRTWAVNVRNWKLADERYTNALASAVKITISRPSFKISRDCSDGY